MLRVSFHFLYPLVLRDHGVLRFYRLISLSHPTGHWSLRWLLEVGFSILQNGTYVVWLLESPLFAFVPRWYFGRSVLFWGLLSFNVFVIFYVLYCQRLLLWVHVNLLCIRVLRWGPFLILFVDRILATHSYILRLDSRGVLLVVEVAFLWLSRFVLVPHRWVITVIMELAGWSLLRFMWWLSIRGYRFHMRRYWASIYTSCLTYRAVVTHVAHVAERPIRSLVLLLALCSSTTVGVLATLIPCNRHILAYSA